MTLDTETIKRLAVESGFHNGEYRPEDITIFGYVVTDKLVDFANAIAALTTELNQIDDVFNVDKVEADAEIGKLVRSKLISGNDVPVSRCYINASEVNAIDEAMKGK